MSQQQLAERLVDAGLPLRLVGQLERGEARLQKSTLLTLTWILELPERWFTEPLEELFREPVDPDVAQELRLLREEIGRLRE